MMVDAAAGPVDFPNISMSSIEGGNSNKTTKYVRHYSAMLARIYAKDLLKFKTTNDNDSLFTNVVLIKACERYIDFYSEGLSNEFAVCEMSINLLQPMFVVSSLFC